MTSRREWLQRTGMIALGVAAFPAWMPRLALAPQGAPTRGDVLVCVFMRGAADCLNLVAPHGDKDYYAARATLAIAQPKASQNQTAIDLDGFFGLHPALRPFKAIYDARDLAIIHAVGSPDPTHSHFDAMDYMERGTPGEKQMTTGWIGRHLQMMATSNQSPFRAIGMGALLQQSLRGTVPATALQSIADFHLQGDQRRVQQMQTALASLYEGDGFIETNGQQTLQAMRDLAKITSSKYTPAGGAKYPDTAFGKSLMAIAQLIKAGIGVEVACADLGGWDTHVQQGNATGQQAQLAEELSQSIAAFYTDMRDQMKQITLVTMTEFGRRVQENSNRGTDHGHGSAMFVLGGNINGGKVYGEWLGLGKDKLYGPGDLAVTTDFRDVLGEIVQKRLANSNLAGVFPNYPTFKFRGIAKEQTAMQTAPSYAIELPFNIRIPLPA
ncbi:MAG: DUF1501 domain-containing protein [Chloroflexi bacterium]|nr:DUF1501 domain-containing protein [Chloroflexota bacterium]